MSITPTLQPLLHDRSIVLRAPVQVWSATDGSIGGSAIDGVYVSDVRVVDGLLITIDGERPEHVITLTDTASRARHVALCRVLDSGDGADPEVRSTLTVETSTTAVEYTVSIESRRAIPIDAEVVVVIGTDETTMDVIKSGNARTSEARPTAVEDGAAWGDGVVDAAVIAPAASVDIDGAAVTLRFAVSVPARGSSAVSWTVSATDAAAVIRAPRAAAPWMIPDTTGVDDRLRRWTERAVDDLDALRLELPARPGRQFLAAGAPWFFTLFGRDSLWAARFLLPLGTGLAAGTLDVLASLQGTRSDPSTAEQPGKIMHELRRGALHMPGEGVELPPLYFGTVDATALWICLLHDTWRAGLADAEVLALLPHLRAALAWMRDFGDSDDDGLLEYVDESGRGLSNQGWKDSGDSVQWRDGRLADGPIALCEVQGYAYEAARHGADLLEAFGEDGGEWRIWAERLRAAFHERFWVTDAAGAYPAIALDAQKNAVDSLTSNIGHLLGTGILDAAQTELVARRLVSSDLDSGFGLRTLSTLDDGYWPLSYHGGAVWAHDTAIAISGLSRSGYREEAAQLAEGLLAAAVSFDFRMPELHSGDPATTASAPAPYPAACRPQAWSAAAAIVVLEALRRP